ncbi:hybrid sensor histidine kinase/response regulator transcription factor [uncultured Proteiniphilum sp.]|uniref:hybrid sensor histidine kinase/response regulator transcription factor n=1 Tax=uncultured Proteiniphilum sp. TaxID=497637 RepID=UPI00261C55A9|nr:hybrid sensor histidine kinase/response regulator transcription factor [uncultured Proteiniphilum sp.]
MQNSNLSPDISFLDVNAFAQDSLGYMWIATLGGLNRYNGYEYQHFSHIPSDNTSLGNDFVFSLLIDSSQNFWVGTANGVSSFDLETNKFNHYAGTITPVYSFFEDHTRQIWAATPLGPGMIDSEKQTVSFPWEPQFVNLFWEDDTHRLWMGLNERQGLAVQKDNMSWEYYTLPGNRSVTCIYSDPQGIWWLGTNAGIVLFDPASHTFRNPEISTIPENTKLNRTQINFIKEVEPLKLLIGTATEGFFYYDLLSQKLQHNMPARFNPFYSAQLHTCYIDKQGNAWIGTYDKGFVIGNKQSDCFNVDHVLSNQFKGKFVTRVIEDESNHFWIATRYDGLYKYNPSEGFITFENQNLFPDKNEFLEVIFIDSEQRIWIAFETQLIIARATQKGHINIIKRLNIENVRVVKEDQGKNIWLGTWEGLFKTTITDEQVKIDKICSSNIPDICILNSGDILFTAFGEGIFKIRNEDPVPQLLDFPDEINLVTSTSVTLFEDSQYRIWMGSYGNGAVWYLNGAYKSFSKENGLPSNNVLCFQEDLNRDIWISTSHGISRLKITEDDIIISNFFKNDGTLGDQYHEKAGCRSSDGRIFFAGNHGLTFFKPSSIVPNHNPPLINIEDLKIFNRSVQPALKGSVLSKNVAHTTEIVLNHKQTTISLDYAGIDFSAPAKLTYKYMLEGFDKQWNEVGGFRRATYSNIPPGKYIFYVSAINGDGIESVYPASLQITVRPAPWFSWQAWLCYSVLLLAMIVVVLRFWFNTKINRQLIEMEHNERMREKEVSKMKINFFTNISHEFRTPLTLISAPLEKLYTTAKLEDQNLKLLDTVYRNVQRMLQLINQLLDFIKIENGVLLLNVQQADIIRELQNIYESFLYLAERKGVKLLFDPHISSKAIWIDTDKIEKILYNLLSNAIKHTPGNGTIEIFTCMLERDEIIQKYGETMETNCSLFMEVTVSDTGPGIPENKLQELFIRYRQINGSSGLNHDYSGSGIGLHYTKTLVESHKGKICARLKPEKGMEFSFIIPAKDVYSEKEKVEIQKDAFTVNTPKVPSILKSERSGTNQKQRYSILIVEDNIELMDFISNLLSEKYHILEATDGDQGWELVQSESPDLLLSDVLMPGLSGYELCSHVKKSPEYCHIPIVLLTAKTSMPEQLEGLEQGANAYICKPFNSDYLLLTIHNLLKNKEILRQFFSTPQKTVRDPLPVTLNKHDQMFMDRLTHLLENKLSDPDLNIDYIARELGFSRTVFYRKIKGLTDISPNDFLKNYRLKSAAEKILNDMASLIEVAEQTGFRSYSYFSKSFKKHFGTTPKEYQSRGNNF